MCTQYEKLDVPIYWTTTAMIVLVICIKKKTPEPYIVIRKETVAVKANEKS
jgi:mannitol/fructose-specific phosphotransferase system IIA component